MKRVDYYITDSYEIMRFLPSGKVAYFDSTTETLRDMRDLHKAGFEVYLDDEPMFPKTGFFGWIHKKLDAISAWRSRS